MHLFNIFVFNTEVYLQWDQKNFIESNNSKSNPTGAVFYIELDVTKKIFQEHHAILKMNIFKKNIF